MTASERQSIIDLIKREVIPAIGCTEPIAVSLCVAKATELLGSLPEKIEVYLSANVLKNAMGVGIPGTGMIGLPIAIALGAIAGKSDYQLEVLRDITPDNVENGKQLIDEKRIRISLKDNIEEKLYIEVICHHGPQQSVAIIAGGHTNFVYLEQNGIKLLNITQKCAKDCKEEELELSMQKVYDFALNAPINDIEFILETARQIGRAHV